VAVTQISDVVVPAEFTAYQVQNSLVSTALFQSGVAIQNGEMASQLQAGAQSFTVPFWNDPADGRLRTCLRPQPLCLFAVDCAFLLLTQLLSLPLSLAPCFSCQAPGSRN